MKIKGQIAHPIRIRTMGGRGKEEDKERKEEEEKRKPYLN